MKKTILVTVSVIILILILLTFLLSVVNVFGVGTFAGNDGSLTYSFRTDETEIAQNDSILYTVNGTGSLSSGNVVSVDFENQRIFIDSSALNLTNNGESFYEETFPIEYTSYVGKVIITVPYLGYISNIISTREGFTFVVIATLACILLLVILTILPKNEADDEDNKEATAVGNEVNVNQDDTSK